MEELLKIKSEAENEAYQYFNDNIRPLPKTSEGKWDFSSGKFIDNDVDAFRHAYVSGVFTQKFGEHAANALGLLNEFDGDFKRDQSLEQKNMDLWNNQIGRKYGKLTQSRKDLAKLLQAALFANELITTIDKKKDPRVYQESDYYKAIDPNKPVIVLEESETGRNKIFLDLIQGTTMSQEDFIENISSGLYPGYSIANINDIPTPISKPDDITTNNLG